MSPLAGVAAFACLLVAVSATCASTHALVGFEGQLSTKSHLVGGTVKILNDCTIEISSFTFDGFAPQTYIWGLTTAPTAGNTGFRLSNTKITQTSGTILITPLPSGVTLDSFSWISVRCEAVSLDMGSVMLTSSTVKGPKDFTSCISLDPG